MGAALARNRRAIARGLRAALARRTPFVRGFLAGASAAAAAAAAFRCPGGVSEAERGRSLLGLLNAHGPHHAALLKRRIAAMMGAPFGAAVAAIKRGFFESSRNTCTKSIL